MKRKALSFLWGMLCVAGTICAQSIRLGSTYPPSGAAPQTYIHGPWYHVLQGDNHLNHRDYEQAIQAYDMAIALAPHLAEAYLKRSTAKRMLGRNQEAAFDLKMAFRHNPYAPDLYGEADPRNRLQVMAPNQETLLRPWPGDYLAEYVQHLIDSVQAGYLVADHSTRQILPEEPAETPKDRLLQLALNYRNEGNRGAALREIQRCIDRYPVSTPARAIAGWLFLESGQLQLASAALNLAREQNPNLAIIDYLLGRLAEGEGRTADALHHYMLAGRDPRIPFAGLAKAALDLKQGNHEEAIATYTRLLNHRPEQSAFLHWNRAVAYACQGEALRALEDLNADRRPESPREHLLRGNLLLLLSQYPEAIEHYSRAIELEPDEVSAYYNRALARILAHDRTEACLDLRRSERLGLTRSTDKITYFCNF